MTDYRDEQIARLTRRIAHAKDALTGPGNLGDVVLRAQAALSEPLPDGIEVPAVSLDQVSRAVMDTLEEAQSEASAERARLLVDAARAYSDLANALSIARGDDA
ncbi:hypothetical protein Q9R08_05010 [Microbacterium sp. QXD-8]|uniref:Uncharacterized protein n=1 Tax=Microbacterium psychrotolerans TaxID=3068321 RepID=A0ABU0YYC1_9MICO|nr:hypothetical protein [Microbacterium sp. QXD-8]MDQ7877332.1 hypothetical protein [Microbacterium sp. QXD-8]